MPGLRLGPYRLIERVGRGRQADVWRAMRFEPTLEEIALKLVPSSARALDPRRHAQFRHEAERGTRLLGPALLPAFDFGEDDGLLFLAMPLVVGCTLGAVLEQRRQRLAGAPVRDKLHPLAVAPEAEYQRAVTALIARVPRAVAFAHDARIVHRDIKPMNILVRRELDIRALPGSWSRSELGVFLCDFGLARDLDVATPKQLRDGAGSPLYMAPERLRKHAADEVRCDVYALGVTLFETLALAPPVEVPPDLPRREWADFLAAARPRRLTEFRPDLPRSLEAVIRRAMEHDPAERQPTAVHLAVELEQILQESRCA